VIAHCQLAACGRDRHWGGTLRSDVTPAAYQQPSGNLPHPQAPTSACASDAAAPAGEASGSARLGCAHCLAAAIGRLAAQPPVHLLPGRPVEASRLRLGLLIRATFASRSMAPFVLLPCNETPVNSGSTASRREARISTTTGAQQRSNGHGVKLVVLDCPLLPDARVVSVVLDPFHNQSSAPASPLPGGVLGVRTSSSSASVDALTMHALRSLDSALQHLSECGVRLVLCTHPAASPPPAQPGPGNHPQAPVSAAAVVQAFLSHGIALVAALDAHDKQAVCDGLRITPITALEAVTRMTPLELQRAHMGILHGHLQHGSARGAGDSVPMQAPVTEAIVAGGVVGGPAAPRAGLLLCAPGLVRLCQLEQCSMGWSSRSARCVNACAAMGVVLALEPDPGVANDMSIIERNPGLPHLALPFPAMPRYACFAATFSRTFRSKREHLQTTPMPCDRRPCSAGSSG
jgi:hypothetical protein